MSSNNHRKAEILEKQRLARFINHVGNKASIWLPVLCSSSNLHWCLISWYIILLFVNKNLTQFTPCIDALGTVFRQSGCMSTQGPGSEFSLFLHWIPIQEEGTASLVNPQLCTWNFCVYVWERRPPKAVLRELDVFSGNYLSVTQ